MTPKETISFLQSANADLTIALNRCNEKRNFLKSIFGTGEKHNNFSEEFHDAAYKEYKAVCEFSSMLRKAIKEQ